MNINKEKFMEHLEKEGFIGDEKEIAGIIASINLGYSLLASGPTGSGKTHFFELLANYLGGHYEYASLNGSVTIHDLTQERILGKKGTFEEQDMVLARWLRAGQDRETVSILQLDEVNAAKPETLMALHPIMDIKGELNLPYSEEVLKVTPNCVLVMTCNEGDEYQGINALNAAFINRFVKVHFKFLSEQKMAQLLTDRTKVPIQKTKAVVNTWVKYMSSKEPEQPVVSTRILERWCAMSHELGLREAGRIVFANLVATSADEVTEIVEGDLFIQLGD